ncbi:MAG: M48 family metallopeptidase [Bacteroidaceae bacterium]|nr:M48 family metallopeptidase [Bacteroidaceae bacterium]
MIRQPRYTPQTRIDTEDFQLKFEQKDVSIAKAEMDEKGIVCYYQSPEVFADKGVQAWITETLEVFARKRVKERLVPRLLDMAKERGIDVKGVRVSSAKGRWGSCSSRGSINLSLYLILLPRHLQDYVLQHELTHRLEMNHSPRFWARLDEVCGGKAKALRKEMRGYNTSFLIQNN